MKTVRILPFVLLALGVVGCASTPKPELTDSQYTEFGTGWLTLDRCAKSGYISPEIAARGQRYLGNSINQYSFNPAFFDTRVTWLAKSFVAPSRDTCVTAEIAIHKRQQQIDSHNQGIATAQVPEYVSTSRQTFCNRVGTQTLCNSF